MKINGIFYLGAISLLGKLRSQVDEESRELIDMALADAKELIGKEVKFTEFSDGTVELEVKSYENG